MPASSFDLMRVALFVCALSRDLRSEWPLVFLLVLSWGCLLLVVARFSFSFGLCLFMVSSPGDSCRLLFAFSLAIWQRLLSCQIRVGTQRVSCCAAAARLFSPVYGCLLAISSARHEGL